MRRLIKKIIFWGILFELICGRNVLAAELMTNAKSTFNSYYLTSIPVNVRCSFETDGGTLNVFPEGGSNTGVYTAGWSGGGTVAGYCELNGPTPIIYLNSKTVDRAKNFYPGTARKIICHEMGHYINAKVNERKYGVKSYTMSPEFVNAYTKERLNYVYAKKMSVGLFSSFERTGDIEEYYANIVAGICTEPVATAEAFPESYAIVYGEMNSL